MRFFRQFFAFCSIVWQNTLAYRSENLVWLFVESAPIIIQLSFWNSLRLAGRIDEQTLSYMTLYYVLGLIIARTTGNHFEEWLIDDIRNGNISANLIKPFSYKIFTFANEVTWRVSGITYTLPILLFLSPFFIPSLSHLSATPARVGLFIGILILAFIQRFFVSWIISLSSFWLEEASVFTHFKWMLEGVIGGAWLPMSFFPQIIQTFSRITPFFSWYSLPIGIILNTETQTRIIQGTITSVVWCLILYGVSTFMWKKAIKKYSASGG